MRLACITSDLTRVLSNIFVRKYQKLNIKFWLSPYCRPGMRRFMLGNANFLHIRNRNLSTDPLMPWIPKVPQKPHGFSLNDPIFPPQSVWGLSSYSSNWLHNCWRDDNIADWASPGQRFTSYSRQLSSAQGKWNVLLCLSTNERTVSQWIWTNESAAISC